MWIPSYAGDSTFQWVAMHPDQVAALHVPASLSNPFVWPAAQPAAPPAALPSQAAAPQLQLYTSFPPVAVPVHLPVPVAATPWAAAVHPGAGGVTQAVPTAATEPLKIDPLVEPASYTTATGGSAPGVKARFAEVQRDFEGLCEVAHMAHAVGSDAICSKEADRWMPKPTWAIHMYRTLSRYIPPPSGSSSSSSVATPKPRPHRELNLGPS
jgi:hypothetical protein